MSQFNCESCDQSFDAKAKLRVHVEKKHATGCPYQCENCEQMFRTQAILNNHLSECTEGFQYVKPPPCRHFVNGFCLKGDQCFFSHEVRPSAPLCRNGPRCPYLANGVCSFYHNGIGVQRPRFQNQSGFRNLNNRRMFSSNLYNSEQYNKWCELMEDCDRVPNCPFSHYEQDFPKLRKNNPPESQRNQTRTNTQDQ